MHGGPPHVRVGIIEQPHQQRHAPPLAGLIPQRIGDRLPNPGIRVGAIDRGVCDERLQRRWMVERGGAQRDVVLLERRRIPVADPGHNVIHRVNPCTVGAAPQFHVRRMIDH